MGVHIYAMSKLRLLDPHERTDDCRENHETAYTYASFARSAEGLADADVESVLGGTMMVAQRCYERTDATAHADILSMSYSGYNQWRTHLAKTVIGKDPKEIWANPNPKLPFIDLINFADNEGCIGPIAAARLCDDFRNPNYRVVRDTFADETDWRWFASAWDGFLAGCELASDGGLIKFS